MIGFHVVDKHTAQNPVARAIAKSKISAAVRDFQCRLHMLEDGEDVASDVHATAHVLAVAARILSQRGDKTPALGIISGGLGALANISETGAIWRKRHLTAVAVALDHALDVYMTAGAKESQRAYQYVMGVH